MIGAAKFLMAIVNAVAPPVPPTDIASWSAAERFNPINISRQLSIANRPGETTCYSCSNGQYIGVISTVDGTVSEVSVSASKAAYIIYHEASDAFYMCEDTGAALRVMKSSNGTTYTLLATITTTLLGEYWSSLPINFDDDSIMCAYAADGVGRLIKIDVTTGATSDIKTETGAYFQFTSIVNLGGGDLAYTKVNSSNAGLIYRLISGVESNTSINGFSIALSGGKIAATNVFPNRDVNVIDVATWTLDRSVALDAYLFIHALTGGGFITHEYNGDEFIVSYDNFLTNNKYPNNTSASTYLGGLAQLSNGVVVAGLTSGYTAVSPAI